MKSPILDFLNRMEEWYTQLHNDKKWSKSDRYLGFLMPNIKVEYLHQSQHRGAICQFLFRWIYYCQLIIVTPPERILEKRTSICALFWTRNKPHSDYFLKINSEFAVDLVNSFFFFSFHPLQIESKLIETYRVSSFKFYRKPEKTPVIQISNFRE